MTTREQGETDVDHSSEELERLPDEHTMPKDTKRKRIVVVGLGMVGIAFM